MAETVIVSSTIVQSCALYRPKSFALRADVIVFAILYAAAANVLVAPESFLDESWLVEPNITTSETVVDHNSTASEDEVGLLRNRDVPGAVALIIVALLHGLTLLVCYWSVKVRATLRYELVNELAKATHVVVIPVPHSGTAAICALHRAGNGLHFEFQQVKFVGESVEDASSNTVAKFQELDFPMNLPLREYLLSRGLSKEKQRTASADKWGKNEFNIPLPKLDELFIEQALAPFFVFQVFCVSLWCLDEYWYYSLFTLAMLVVFELTVCLQRQKDMQVLRAMRKPPYPIYVLRQGRWTQILTDELVPGDICSLVKSDRGSGDTPSNSPSRGRSASEISRAMKRLVPCDCLLLSGNCVVNEAMLTGESVPKAKSSVAEYFESDIQRARENLVISEGHTNTDTVHDKQVVLGGTAIVQHHSAPYPKDLCKSLLNTYNEVIPTPPDGGCVAYVLRTGYYTCQGRLMRTILFSTERVTVDNNETYLFILVLLVFAVIAAGYVLMKGLEDETRSRWKLLLHCIMIITSVVPPELPMELSLAVTTSLVRLKAMSVFCTEPYRIPFAGKVDVCCFDKTGTLTSDNLLVKGVAESLENREALTDVQLTKPREVSKITRLVLGACHELVRVDGIPQGDPMEKASLKSINWTIHTDGTVGPAPVQSHNQYPVQALASSIMAAQGQDTTRVQKVAVHAFSSAMRRMSCAVRVAAASGDDPEYFVLCKGAPEVLEACLKTIPDGFRETYQELMRSGFRVLALAAREVSGKEANEKYLHSMSRADMEHNLDFVGLLVLDCPMKDDTKDSIDQLLDSGHRVVVITGDNALTACNVASELRILRAPQDKTLLLKPAHENCSPSSPDDLVWLPLSQHDGCSSELHTAFSQVTPVDLSTGENQHDLVVTGDVLACLESSLDHEEFLKWMQVVCPYATVFARVAPRHKEIIVACLKTAGLITLMCGDGTNDVGALKQADVGVSIINNPDVEHQLKTARRRVRLLEKKRGSKAPPLTFAQKAELELQAMQEMSGGDTMLNLGDASIASPFTSQSPTIRCTVDIIKQGRCTLVTTIQMFKILALNCMVSAYSLSALHLHGVKQGDTQMTLAGLLIAGLFMAISMSQPLDKLSDTRPTSKIFSLQVGLSLLGQLTAHMCSLLYVLHLSAPFIDTNAEEMQPDADFKPNVINTAVFGVSLCMQVNIFACNYRGRPYMTSLLENKPLHRVLLAVWILDFVLVSELVPELGEAFELVPLPTDGFRLSMLACLIANTAFVWIWELGVRFMIPG